MPKTARSKNQTEEVVVSPQAAEAVSSAPEQPSAEAITRRAYELFLERGGTHGNDVDDWVRAELELSAAQSEAKESPSAREIAPATDE
jgi:hypothetical protein